MGADRALLLAKVRSRSSHPRPRRGPTGQQPGFHVKGGASSCSIPASATDGRCPVDRDTAASTTARGACSARSPAPLCKRSGARLDERSTYECSTGRAIAFPCKRSRVSPAPRRGQPAHTRPENGFHCLLLFRKHPPGSDDVASPSTSAKPRHAAVSVADRVTAPLVGASAPQASTAAPGRRRARAAV